MSACHGCTQTFGFLKREFGCPKCGFSYCKKCLRYKIVDPKTTKELTVCHRCHKLLTSNMDPEEPPLITKALLRLESMENPARPPITMYKQPAREARLAQLRKGLSVEDQQIADRLESLRRPEGSNNAHAGHRRSSEQIELEIETRLARLKDQDLPVQSKSPLVGRTEPETDVGLIAKYSAEVELDKQYETKVVSDIEMRLAKLRGEELKEQAPSSSGTKSFEIPELSEEEQIAKIIERFTAEVELEAKNPVNEAEVEGETVISSLEDVSMHSDEEDNLCRICDEKRATLKCEECDGDLFCPKCFKELHIELGEVHKPTPFKA